MKIHLLTFLGFLLFCNTVFSQTYRCAVSMKGRWGYINEKGKVVVPTVYSKAFPFSNDGVALVAIAGSQEYLLIDTAGVTLKTEVKINTVKGNKFIDGMLPIRVGGKWGFMNSAGKLIIYPKYNDATTWSDGHAVVKFKNDYFIIDTGGNEKLITSGKITNVEPFYEGLASYKSGGGSEGFINVEGKVVIPPVHYRVGNFHGGYAWVKDVMGNVRYVNRKGEHISRDVYEVGKDFDPVSKMALAKKNGEWDFIDGEGKRLNVKVDVYGDFMNGFAYCRISDKVGFMGPDGKWAINPQFRAVRDFKNGYAAATMEDLWGIIDESGYWAVDPKFDAIKDMEKID